MDHQHDTVSARAAYVMGDVVREWPPETVAAWTGFIEVFARIKGDVDRELASAHGLNTTMVGLLGRLAAADGGARRLTDLANAMGRSLSRVSRSVDILEQRGLVERRPDPTDARATNAHLTRDGLALARRAQATAAAAVQRTFVEPLGPDDVRALAGVFDRMLSSAERSAA